MEAFSGLPDNFPTPQKAGLVLKIKLERLHHNTPHLFVEWGSNGTSI